MSSSAQIDGLSLDAIRSSVNASAEMPSRNLLSASAAPEGAAAPVTMPSAAARRAALIPRFMRPFLQHILRLFARFCVLPRFRETAVIPEHRRTRILELLTARQQTSVNDLADDLCVSRETVRRDLGLLEEDGLLRKVHGGAVPVQTGAEPVVKLRAGQQRLEKLAIGERAAALFTAGDSLFVDAGTTTA